uniref:Uncharacterized protein n=1 Tax=Hymenopteran tombus-related virus TaxID=2822555 RepID=A0A8A6RQ28_9TOMB|nr:hypothetical protein [Hymenopteran tombus-related virus]
MQNRMTETAANPPPVQPRSIISRVLSPINSLYASVASQSGDDRFGDAIEQIRNAEAIVNASRQELLDHLYIATQGKVIDRNYKAYVFTLIKEYFVKRKIINATEQRSICHGIFLEHIRDRLSEEPAYNEETIDYLNTFNELEAGIVRYHRWWSFFPGTKTLGPTLNGMNSSYRPTSYNWSAICLWAIGGVATCVIAKYAISHLLHKCGSTTSEKATTKIIEETSKMVEKTSKIIEKAIGTIKPTMDSIKPAIESIKPALQESIIALQPPSITIQCPHTQPVLPIPTDTVQESCQNMTQAVCEELTDTITNLDAIRKLSQSTTIASRWLLQQVADYTIKLGRSWSVEDAYDLMYNPSLR